MSEGAVSTNNSTMHKTTARRIPWVDILRGFLMFFVIYAHTTTNQDINNYIYSFHMPAFFLVSGMTFAFNKERRILPYLKKKLLALIVPYFLLNLYVSPIWYWTTQFGAEPQQKLWQLAVGVLLSNKATGFRMASNTTWFICCLFLADLFFFFIWRKCRTDIAVVLGCVLVTTSAYACGIVARPGAGPWHVETAFTAMIFILGGYLFLKYHEKIEAFLDRIGMARTVLLILLLFAIGFMLFFRNGRVSMIADSYNNLGYFYGSAFATTLGIALSFMLASRKAGFVKGMTLVNQVGKYTLPYIAFQVPLMRVLRHYIPFFGNEADWHRFVLSLVVFFGFLPVAMVIQNYLIPKRKK